MGTVALMADGGGKPGPPEAPDIISRKEQERREARHEEQQRRTNEARVEEIAKQLASEPAQIDLARESVRIAVSVARKPMPVPVRLERVMEIVNFRGEPIRTLCVGQVAEERARAAQSNRRTLESLRWTERTLRAAGKTADAERVVKHLQEHWTPKVTP